MAEVNWQQNQTRCLPSVTHLTRRTREVEQGLMFPSSPPFECDCLVWATRRLPVWQQLGITFPLSLLWLMGDLLRVYSGVSIGGVNCAGLLVSEQRKQERCHAMKSIKSIQWITRRKTHGMYNFPFDVLAIKLSVMGLCINISVTKLQWNRICGIILIFLWINMGEFTLGSRG